MAGSVTGVSDEEPFDATTADPEAGRGRALTPRRARARHYIRRRRTLNGVYRIAVAVVGGAVTFAGVAMLALPGPGWAAIFVGLAILATEFHWARRLLHRARVAYERARKRALDPKVRRRNQITASVAGVALAVGAGWWVVMYGVPFM